MANVSIIGSGSFGMALAIFFVSNSHSVLLWSRNSDDIDYMKKNRRSKRFLTDIEIPDTLEITDDISALGNSDVVFLAVPSIAIEEVCEKLKGIVNCNCIIVNVSKGFNRKTGAFLSDVIKNKLPKNPFVFLSGPSHAEELVRNIPTAMVASSDDRLASSYIQDNFSSNILRIYLGDDLIGAQVGAALKNVIALACGICEGMKLGDNSKAALMTRGLAEISRLGVLLGAKQETFSGLTGLGDLIVTCTSDYSRNRRFGILLGQGLAVNDALSKIGMVVEGYLCIDIAFKISREYKVSMPVVESLYMFLYCGANLKDIIFNLMDRPKRAEY